MKLILRNYSDRFVAGFFGKNQVTQSQNHGQVGAIRKVRTAGGHLDTYHHSVKVLLQRLTPADVVFNLVAWDKTAEIMSKWLEKGRRILVEGRLQTNNYEKNGVKVNGYDVIVSQIFFADSKKKADDDQFGGQDVSDDDTPF